LDPGISYARLDVFPVKISCVEVLEGEDFGFQQIPFFQPGNSMSEKSAILCRKNRLTPVREIEMDSLLVLYSA